MRKKDTFQAYFYLSIQSGLVCNGKMKLKSDIRIKILNDKYRPIDLCVCKKNKQTNKQTKTKNEQKNHVSKSVIKKRNQHQQTKKQKTKQNKTKQNKTKQIKTKQNKTKQNKTTTIKREMTI